MSGSKFSRRTSGHQLTEANAERWHELYKTLAEVRESPHAGADFLSFHRDRMAAAHERLLELGLDVSDHRKPRVVPVPVARHPKTDAEARRWDAEIAFRIEQFMLCFSVSGAGAHVVRSAVGTEPRIKTAARVSHEGSGASQPHSSVYVPEYKPSRAKSSRFAVSEGYRTATNAGLSPSFTLAPALRRRFQATDRHKLSFRAVLAEVPGDARFGRVRLG